MDVLRYLSDKLPKAISANEIISKKTYENLKSEEYYLEVRVSIYEGGVGYTPRYWGADWDDDPFYCDEIEICSKDDNKYFVSEIESWFKCWFSKDLCSQIDFWEDYEMY